MLSAGCVTISRKHTVAKQEILPQLDASEEQLLAAYNLQARAIQTLQATVDMIPGTGSTYSGVIEEYHDVPGFILAQRPGTVRIIGQAPLVAKNIFDMVSDGTTFKIFIPSKNSFLVGSTSVSRAAKTPLENLRPQHVVDALFWPELTSTENVLFEQFNAEPRRYYVLTVLRPITGGRLEISRKAWFDRATLEISRVQLYGRGGRLDSDIAYSDWQPIAPASGSTAVSAPVQPKFARDIHVARPQDDYRLEIRITKLSVNEPIAADRFELEQPPGAQLVKVGDEPAEAKQ